VLEFTSDLSAAVLAELADAPEIDADLGRRLGVLIFGTDS
jgi:hypothetical protein